MLAVVNFPWSSFLHVARVAGMFGRFVVQTLVELGLQALLVEDFRIFTSVSLGESRDSAVGIATGYGLDDRGVVVRVPVGSRIFTSPCPDRLWGSSNLLSNAYRGLFTWE
jgi:hypothetical protein